MIGQTTTTMIRRIGSYLFLSLTAVVCMYPALWVVLSSFRPGNSLFSETLFPSDFTVLHYRELFTNYMFGQWYFNTLTVAVPSMLLGTISILTTSYAFSMFRFPSRKQLMNSLLVLGLFPGFMSMIAIYILLLQLGLLDNHWGLILVYSGGSIPFGAWLVKGYFDAMPRSLEEAAKIDGAGNVTVFLRIMLPLSRPILVFLAITNFIGPWMDFIFARLVLRSNEQKTLAVGLFEMVTGRGNTEFTTFAAGAVIIAVPITLLFLTFQKHLVEGLKAGANKG